MAEPDQPSEPHVLAERREKLERLRESGVEPFPHDFDGRVDIATVREAHGDLPDGEETDDAYRVAGRVAARRGQGKAAFIDLVDGTGRIQVLARVDALGAEAFDSLIAVDLGDIIGVDGVAMKTRRGELSIAATGWTLLA
jgi:lysyl-tRNA synthetase class 2